MSSAKGSLKNRLGFVRSHTPALIVLVGYQNLALALERCYQKDNNHYHMFLFFYESNWSS